ncbi:hypothetical protein BDB01DRAFT_712982 [Pilobolus umbonatus]|nr:hypothetical protein BDB01DRAFT_712982 [Pilobolus umbonatus]
MEGVSNLKYGFSSEGYKVDLDLLVQVNNPNVLDIDVSNMISQAYYPLNGELYYIGQGYKESEWIPKQSDHNLSFPFQLVLNPGENGVFSDVLSKCGRNERLDIQYNIALHAKVLFVERDINTTSSTSIDCPM